MAQQISGDPRARYIFGEDENLWTDTHNRNWTETVGQLNQLQDALLGDAGEATLTSYSGDAIGARVSTLETDLEAAELEQAAQDSRISAKPDTSLVKTWMQALSVGTVAGGDATTVLTESGIQADLISGDRLFIVDESAETVTERAVTADAAEGVTSISVASDLEPPAGAKVILHPGDARVDPSIDLTDITDAVWGPGRTSADVEGNHETRLQQIEDQVQSANQQIRAVGSLSGQMRNEVQEFRNEVVGTVTELETTAEGAALQASTFTPGDKPVLKLSQDYEAQSTSELAVTWTGDAPSTGFEAGDILVLKNRDDQATVLTLADTPTDTGTSPIQLDQSYEIDADVDSEIYLAVTSVASKIEARTNGNVVVEGKAARSARWDGELESVSIDGQDFHQIKRDDQGNVIDAARGTVGWVLASAGEFVATNAYLRGNMAIQRATIEGGVLVDEGAFLRTKSGNWSITDDGFNVAPSEKAFADVDQAFTFADGKYGLVGMIAGRARGRARGLVISATGGDRENQDVANDVVLRLRSEESIEIDAASDIKISAEEHSVAVDTGLFQWEFPTSPDVGGGERRSPVFNSPTDFVDWVRTHRTDVVGNGLTVTEAAAKMKGFLFVDASDYQLKYFHPDMVNATSESTLTADVDFGVEYLTRRRRSFTAEVQTNGKVTNYKWQYGTGGTAEGPYKRRRTFTYDDPTENTPDNYTATLTVTIESPDGSNSSTFSKSHDVEIKPETVTIDPPDGGYELPGSGGLFGGGGLFDEESVFTREEIRIK